MKKICFCTAGSSPALRHARNTLESWGYPLAQAPDKSVTHLLLPVPSLEADGSLRGGGDLAEIISRLGTDVTVFGGNLKELPCRTVDFLQDGYYLWENAAITAQCALKYASIRAGMPVMVIGWGRIGKHLATLLEELGADVTVAVRKQADLDALRSQGFKAVYLSRLCPWEFRVVFNTAPAPVLSASDCQDGATLIDLASERGILGQNVIWARGLPGKDAPEVSGNLIAKTALRYALGKE